MSVGSTETGRNPAGHSVHSRLAASKRKTFAVMQKQDDMVPKTPWAMPMLPQKHVEAMIEAAETNSETEQSYEINAFFQLDNVTSSDGGSSSAYADEVEAKQSGERP